MKKVDAQPVRTHAYKDIGRIFASEILGAYFRNFTVLQMKHTMVKNPNRPEANQLDIYKRSRWI